MNTTHPFPKMIFTLLSFCLLQSMLSPLMAADKKGSKDFPLISRYKGSEIAYYNYKKFDDYNLIVKPITQRQKPNNTPDILLPLEGKVTRLLYRNPAERSSLEVFRNYEDALKKAGFEILFSCKKNTCGGYNFNRAISPSLMIGSQEQQRYLAAKLTREEEGDVYVALYVTAATDVTKRMMSMLHVVEVAPMEKEMVAVTSKEMLKGIDKDGKIALYGIFFDSDKATIKAESKPTLDQISALLKEKPDLKLIIVGHTDNEGKMDYNMNLSKKRAEAVRASLIKDYKVSKKRLKSWGVGYLSPLGTNKNEAGRAKNRRVELVEQ